MRNDHGIFAETSVASSIKFSEYGNRQYKTTCYRTSARQGSPMKHLMIVFIAAALLSSGSIAQEKTQDKSTTSQTSEQKSSCCTEKGHKKCKHKKGKKCSCMQKAKPASNDEKKTQDEAKPESKTK